MTKRPLFEDCLNREDLDCFDSRTFPQEETEPILIREERKRKSKQKSEPTPEPITTTYFSLDFLVKALSLPKDFFKNAAHAALDSQLSGGQNWEELDYVPRQATQNFFYDQLMHDTTFILSDTNVGRDFDNFILGSGHRAPHTLLRLRANTTIGHQGMCISYNYAASGIPYDHSDHFFITCYDSTGQSFGSTRIEGEKKELPYWYGDRVDPEGKRYLDCLRNAVRILKNAPRVGEHQKAFITSMLLRGLELVHLGETSHRDWSPPQFRELVRTTGSFIDERSDTQHMRQIDERLRRERIGGMLTAEDLSQRLLASKKPYRELMEIKEELLPMAGEEPQGEW